MQKVKALFAAALVMATVVVGALPAFAHEAMLLSLAYDYEQASKSRVPPPRALAAPSS